MNVKADVSVSHQLYVWMEVNFLFVNIVGELLYRAFGK